MRGIYVTTSCLSLLFYKIIPTRYRCFFSAEDTKNKELKTRTTTRIQMANCSASIEDDDKLFLDLDQSPFPPSPPSHKRQRFSCGLESLRATAKEPFSRLPEEVYSRIQDYIAVYLIVEETIELDSGHAMTSVAVSNEGAIAMASVAADGCSGEVRLWATPYKQSKVVCVRNAEITHCTFSSDGKYLVVCSKDSHVAVWSTCGDMVMEKEFRAHTGSVMCASFNSQVGLIASVDSNNGLCFWCLLDRAPKCLTTDIPVAECSWSPDGTFLLLSHDNERRSVSIGYTAPSAKGTFKTMLLSLSAIHPQWVSPNKFKCAEGNSVLMFEIKDNGELVRNRVSNYPARNGEKVTGLFTTSLNDGKTFNREAVLYEDGSFVILDLFRSVVCPPGTFARNTKTAIAWIPSKNITFLFGHRKHLKMIRLMKRK